MRFEITGVPKYTIRTLTVLPPEYIEFWLPVSKVLVETSPVADIIYQERTVRGCSQCNIIFIIKKACILKPTVKGPFSAINCMLKGSVEVILKGEVKVMLYQGQYNAFQVDESDHVAYFQPGIYEANHFDYTRNVIATLAHSSDIVRRWLKMIDANEAAAVMPAPGIIWSDLYRLVDEVKRRDVTSPLMEQWLFTKLTEVLIITLNDQQEKQYNRNGASNSLFETMRSYIVNNLGQRITISQLAKDYNMSKSKLKKDFTKHFGIPFSRYFFEQKMYKSKELLQQGQNISSVAYTLGYQYPANFSREFKHFFGHLPGQQENGDN